MKMASNSKQKNLYWDKNIKNTNLKRERTGEAILSASSTHSVVIQLMLIPIDSRLSSGAAGISC